MKRDAEAHAKEDEAKVEEIGVHNQADQIVSQTQTQLEGDFGEKLSDEEKQSIESVVSNLEDANKGTDIQSIKDRMDELNKVMMEVSQKMYQTDEPQQQESKPDVEDAEFEEV